MRKGSLIAVLAAAALGAIGFAVPVAAQKAAVMQQQMRAEPSLRRQRSAAGMWWRDKPLRPRGAKTQRHTGAGGRGMHRHWKAVRAAGRR